MKAFTSQFTTNWQLKKKNSKNTYTYILMYLCSICLPVVEYVVICTYVCTTVCMCSVRIFFVPRKRKQTMSYKNVLFRLLLLLLLPLLSMCFLTLNMARSYAQVKRKCEIASAAMICHSKSSAALSRWTRKWSQHRVSGCVFRQISFSGTAWRSRTFLFAYFGNAHWRSVFVVFFAFVAI